MLRKPHEIKDLVRAGLAQQAADTVIQGGQLVNVLTQEIYPADIAIYQNMIVATGDVSAYIGSKTQIVSAGERFLVPGLIDGHIHSECSKMSLTSYARAVVPRGTTSMVSGLDEYISVVGLAGLPELFMEIQDSPLKVFWGAPYKTPYTFPPSTIAGIFDPQTHKQVQEWPECYGIWETVREAVTTFDDDTYEVLALAAANRQPVFGCAPMARGITLNGYLCAGVRLDHESYDHEEIVEKLRKGMYVLIRESSVTHFLAENIRALTEVIPSASRRVSFCTDDVTASDILREGHLDEVVRKAIRSGIDPLVAIQMATINSAEAYRIDHLVGSLAPGRIADILLVDDLDKFNVCAVFSEGKLVAKDHSLTSALPAPKRSQLLSAPLKCPPATLADFTYRVEGINNGKAKVLSMDVKGPFVRKKREAWLKVTDGVVLPDPDQDVLLVSVLERFGKNGNRSLGFCSGWKLKRGAMASSAAPDDNNIIVLGASAQDMVVATNYLIEKGGGQVVVADGEILGFLPLPVGGICSDEDPAWIAKQEQKLNALIRELGSELGEPLMYMFFLPITAIPDYAITDRGPIDCQALEVFNPILELRET